MPQGQKLHYVRFLDEAELESLEAIDGFKGKSTDQSEPRFSRWECRSLVSYIYI